MSRRLWRVRFAGINEREWLAFVQHAITGQEVRVRNRPNSTGPARCDECGPGSCVHVAAANRAYRKSTQQGVTHDATD